MFERKVDVRFTPEQYYNIQKIVGEYPDVYESVSTYVRAAVLRQLRKEMGEWMQDNSAKVIISQQP